MSGKRLLPEDEQPVLNSLRIVAGEVSDLVESANRRREAAAEAQDTQEPADLPEVAGATAPGEAEAPERESKEEERPKEETSPVEKVKKKDKKKKKSKKEPKERSGAEASGKDKREEGVVDGDGVDNKGDEREAEPNQATGSASKEPEEELSRADQEVAERPSEFGLKSWIPQEEEPPATEGRERARGSREKPPEPPGPPPARGDRTREGWRRQRRERSRSRRRGTKGQGHRERGHRWKASFW